MRRELLHRCCIHSWIVDLPCHSDWLRHGCCATVDAQAYGSIRRDMPVTGNNHSRCLAYSVFSMASLANRGAL